MDTATFELAESCSGAREGSLASASASVPARLVEYSHRRYIALAPHVTIEIVDRPKLLAVPGAAYYARGLLRWQDQWVAVIDLFTLLRAYPSDIPVPLRYVLVVAYQEAPNEPIRHGAFTVPSLPRMIEVGDDVQCALPSDSDLWPLIALSCFRHQGAEVPILDCGRLFGATAGAWL